MTNSHFYKSDYTLFMTDSQYLFCKLFVKYKQARLTYFYLNFYFLYPIKKPTQLVDLSSIAIQL